MQLVIPDIGLLFWMLLSFGIVLFILKKFAWKPILSALDEREESIADSLNSAKQAREEMERLKADNEKILEEAKVERDQLIKEAREIKQEIIEEAKSNATTEAAKIIEAARVDIENQRMIAVNQMKAEMIELSVEIAEKVLHKELSAENKQSEFINDLVADIKFN